MIEHSLISYQTKILSLLGEPRELYVVKDIVPLLESAPEFSTFISAEIAWWTYTALLKKEFGHRFPVNNQLLHEQSREVIAYLTSIAECTHEELTSLAKLSGETYINGLFRPLATIEAFIFRNEESKSAHEIMLRCQALSMPYFSPMGVISEAIVSDNRHPSLLIISKSEFITSCKDAFRSSVARNSPSEMIDDLSPMFEWMNAFHNEDGIPIELLKVFFDEAGQERIVSALLDYRLSKELHSISLHQLTVLLQSLTVAVPEHRDQPVSKEIKKTSSGTYFGDKGIKLLTRDRLSGIQRRRVIEREAIEEELHSVNGETSALIDQLLKEHSPHEMPLRMIKRSFLGAIPMQVQMHYADALFGGDLRRLRKLGASIDKTVGIEAALSTCKAFVNQYGEPILDSQDSMNTLYGLIEIFCESRKD